MRLSELRTGEKGVIVKVMGRGAFRKRIIEMGFIRGKEVDVIQNAPLKDPIHYRVMGYDVSLRRNDAQMIEVVSAAEFPFHVIINPSYEPIGTETRSFYEGCLSFDGYQAVRKRWLDITARWQDEDGNKHEEHLHGWPARIFQHETDHLSGELYIDQAEIRSLTTNENLEDFWCEDPVPTEAAAELGFEL